MSVSNPQIPWTDRDDVVLFDWIETHKAQVWWDRHNNNWICQVIYHPHVIQPARASLRAAIVDCKAQFELKQIS